MNTIEIRNKIIEAINQPICDENELDELFLERRIDEVLELYVIEENNKKVMTTLSNKVKLNKTLNSFKFDDLFNVNKISGENLKLYYKAIIDRELRQFNVESNVWDSNTPYKLIIETAHGEITIQLEIDYNDNKKRHLWMRVLVYADKSVPRESTSCNNAVYFEYTIRNWINQI